MDLHFTSEFILTSSPHSYVSEILHRMMVAAKKESTNVGGAGAPPAEHPTVTRGTPTPTTFGNSTHMGTLCTHPCPDARAPNTPYARYPVTQMPPRINAGAPRGAPPSVWVQAMKGHDRKRSPTTTDTATAQP